MNETILEILEYGIGIVVIVIARYLIPWIRQELKKEEYAQKIDKVEYFAQWVRDAVYCAQQLFWESSGEDRKAFVESFLMDIIQRENIPVTAEQLDILIEAAVRQMKIEEGRK